MPAATSCANGTFGRGPGWLPRKVTIKIFREVPQLCDLSRRAPHTGTFPCHGRRTFRTLFSFAFRFLNEYGPERIGAGPGLAAMARGSPFALSLALALLA